MIDVVEGWTGDLDFQLLADGQPVDLEGLDVELVLRDANGADVDTEGKTSVADAGAGVVRFNPHAEDLEQARSPYTARWKVTDGGERSVFFPSGESMTWRVRR